MQIFRCWLNNEQWTIIWSLKLCIWACPNTDTHTFNISFQMELIKTWSSTSTLPHPNKCTTMFHSASNTFSCSCESVYELLLFMSLALLWPPSCMFFLQLCFNYFNSLYLEVVSNPQHNTNKLLCLLCHLCNDKSISIHRRAVALHRLCRVSFRPDSSFACIKGVQGVGFRGSVCCSCHF